MMDGGFHRRGGEPQPGGPAPRAARPAVYVSDVHEREGHGDACFWPARGSLDAICWSCAVTVLRGAPRDAGPAGPPVCAAVPGGKREFMAKVRGRRNALAGRRADATRRTTTTETLTRFPMARARAASSNELIIDRGRRS